MLKRRKRAVNQVIWLARSLLDPLEKNKGGQIVKYLFFCLCKTINPPTTIFPHLTFNCRWRTSPPSQSMTHRPPLRILEDTKGWVGGKMESRVGGGGCNVHGGEGAMEDAAVGGVGVGGVWPRSLTGGLHLISASGIIYLSTLCIHYQFISAIPPFIQSHSESTVNSIIHSR